MLYPGCLSGDFELLAGAAAGSHFNLHQL